MAPGRALHEGQPGVVQLLEVGQMADPLCLYGYCRICLPSKHATISENDGYQLKAEATYRLHLPAIVSLDSNGQDHLARTPHLARHFYHQKPSTLNNYNFIPT
jgi:hypothetical protein